jgi:hypothetical protein
MRLGRQTLNAVVVLLQVRNGVRVLVHNGSANRHNKENVSNIGRFAVTT